MREIKFAVGSKYSYDYDENTKLTVLCTKISGGYGEFSLVAIKGNFNIEDMPYAMLTIKLLCKDIKLFIKTSINFDKDGGYEYEYVSLEDGLLCSTEEVK